MKAIAAILCLYLFGLCIQPALFPLHNRKAKALACCSKDKDATHKGGCGSENNCCGDNPCNPFFSQCPLCSAVAIQVTSYACAQPGPIFTKKNVFASFDHQLIGRYSADILHPPQVV